MSRRGYKDVEQLGNRQLRRLIEKSIENAGSSKRQKLSESSLSDKAFVNETSSNHPVKDDSVVANNESSCIVESFQFRDDGFSNNDASSVPALPAPCSDSSSHSSSIHDSPLHINSELPAACANNSVVLVSPQGDVLSDSDDDLYNQCFETDELCFDASEFINDDSRSFEDFVLVCDTCARCGMCTCLLACGQCKHSPTATCVHCAKCTENCDFEYALPDDIFPENELVSSESVPLSDDLADWAIDGGITHASLRKLLAIFSKHHPEDNLPKDPRTLLGTARKVTIRDVPPGSYWHNGLKKNLIAFFADSEEQEVKLSFNVDGLPISASTGSSLWPILCNIVGSDEVFAIGIYHGYSKPESESVYLQEFDEELIELLKDGFDIGGSYFEVCVHCFICDAPAKCFVLCIKGHTGYFSCTKCIQQGKMVKNRMCFPETTFTLRTDNSFIQQEQGRDFHHATPSILSVPGVRPVTGFVLDPLHLLYLGVMKKLLLFWVFGKRSLKLGKKQCDEISSSLKLMRRYRPIEFARMPLSLEFSCRFKGTEFRMCLLYLGPVIFRLLKPELYENFLVLHVAVRLLSSKEFCIDFNEYAGVLMKNFVTNFIQIYGEEYVSHNVHGCLHIHKDVLEYGPLEFLSAFKFENFMQKLKKLVRKGEKPLQQVAKRYSEMEAVKFKKMKFVSLPSEKIFLCEHSEGPLVDNCSFPQYKVLKFNNVEINVQRDGDCCVGLTDGSVVIVKNFARDLLSEKMVLIGWRYKFKENLYSKPIESSQIGIFKVYGQTGLQKWPVDKISHKFFRVPCNEKFAVLPLLN